jgi:3-oxoadipate enol-lactonase
LANALSSHHRVICHDHRGHGDSDTPSGAYTMAELADDAERLLSEIDARFQCGPVVWIGLSLGGMVGQEIASRCPERLKALVSANACAGYNAEARAQWQQRIAAVESQGLESVADATMERWFSDGFRAAKAATVARWRRRMVSTPVAGYLGASHAVMNHDTTARLPHISVPTLVIASSADVSVPLAQSKAVADAIAGAQWALIEDAAHLSVLEQPAAFEAAITAFLRQL